MASFGIGAKLRQERVGKGLAIDDISRDTRIAPRFLEAIETDDYSILPGLIFTRNFVRQYALTLHLDPDPLLAELPKQDESTAPLPAAPQHPRSSYYADQRLRSIVSSIVWLVVAGGAGGAAYMYFNHSLRAAFHRSGGTDVRAAAPVVSKPTPAVPSTPVQQISATAAGTTAGSAIPEAHASTTAPVQVSLTAREAAWVKVTADDKIVFVGTLQPNETREIPATEQVRVLTGNAGALKISLNGTTLDSLGPLGQVREVKLTAEGPELLSKVPQPAPDPL